MRMEEGRWRKEEGGSMERGSMERGSMEEGGEEAWRGVSVGVKETKMPRLGLLFFACDYVIPRNSAQVCEEER
jgi:hypothetical protein